MTYSEPLFNQISRFVTSIGFGFFLCILYVAVVFLRMCISEKRWAIILQDLIFSFLATIISFFFMVLYNNGEVRLNLVTGQLIGGLVLYFTVGKYILLLLEKCAFVVRKILAMLLLPLKLYLKAFPSFFKSIIIKIRVKKPKAKGKPGKKEKSGRKTDVKRKNIPKTPLKNQNKSV